MKNLKYLLLTLLITGNLYSEVPIVEGSLTVRDAPFSRVMQHIGNRFDVQFVPDPSIEFSRVSFVFYSNESLVECLAKMQNDLIEDGLFFTYIEERHVVFVTEFSDKDLLNIILSRRAETEND